MLKTGRRCSWDELEVGEVFAVYGHCKLIEIKVSNEKSLTLADSCADVGCLDITGDVGGFAISNNFYKLPLSVQRLWRED